MVLVDTSILIDYLKGRQNKSTKEFKHIRSMRIPYGINVYIYQELLQGCASKKEYQLLKKYLDTQVFYSLRKHRQSFAKAAMIYLKCRKKGYTVNSTIDCLIAQTALENNLYLLHNDSDFDSIKKVEKELKIY